MNALAAARSFDDRLNPILVKEVRQALRGRYFRTLFWLTLGVATLIGLSIVAEAGSRGANMGVGRTFFMLMNGCLFAAVLGFTPFSAFLATSAEWDENTHDLLVLSNLRPRQIVYGKLLSALVQALLYYATFGPFLVFAFLMNGVDLLSIGVLLLTSFVACATLNLLGIAMASLSPAKAPRVLLMALFGVALMMSWGFSISFATFVTYQPHELRDPMALPAIVAFVVGCLLVGGLFASLAIARLSHDEENRSSGLRALSVALVLVAAVFGLWMELEFGHSEFAWGLQLAVLVPLVMLWLHFLCEPEALGRHVARHVSPRPALALLSAPFLPGGGRGAVLMALHMALGLSAVLAVRLVPGSDKTELNRALIGLALVYAYVWIYLAIPAGIASWFSPKLSRRVLTRLVIIGLVPVAVLLPPLLGLVLGIPSWLDFMHPLNPMYPLKGVISGSSFSRVEKLWLLTAALAAIVLNTPRIARGLQEVLAASRARRSRASSV